MRSIEQLTIACHGKQAMHREQLVFFLVVMYILTTCAMQFKRHVLAAVPKLLAEALLESWSIRPR